MKRNLFLNYRKKLIASILVLFSFITIKAQVGINVNKPESILDVKGDIKVGSIEKTDAQGKAGMLQWNDNNKCFEGHDGDKWKCLLLKSRDAHAPINEANVTKENKILVKAWGGDILKNADHFNHVAYGDRLTEASTLKFISSSGAKAESYDKNSGAITIPQDGWYLVKFVIAIATDDKDENTRLQEFPKGNRALMNYFLEAKGEDNNIWRSDETSVRIGRGQIINGGGTADPAYNYDDINPTTEMVFLKKGDKLSLRYYATKPNNVYWMYIIRKYSFISLSPFMLFGNE